MAYTTRFEDTFTEASDTALASHTPDVGTSWSAPIGTGSGPPTVIASDDTLCHPFSGGPLTALGSQANISGAWTADQEAEATNFDGTGLNIQVGTRIQNDGAGEPDGYAGAFDYPGDIQHSILRCDSNVFTSLASEFATYDDTTIGTLRSEGNVHKWYLAGVEELSVTDSTYPSGGKPGVFSIRTIASAGIDNFKARDQEVVAAGHPTMRRWGGIPGMDFLGRGSW